MTKQYEYCRVSYSELTLENLNALGKKGWGLVTIDRGNGIFKREMKAKPEGIVELTGKPVLFEFKDDCFSTYDEKFILVGDKAIEQVAKELIECDKDCNRITIKELQGGEYISTKTVTRDELTFVDGSSLEEFRFVVKDVNGGQIKQETKYLKSLDKAMNHALGLTKVDDCYSVDIQKWIENETLFRHQETVTYKDLPR
ncbi:hypothetical protein COF68_05360 [Bacillus toyonensis]|uniref:hypothetical protein n=1 Tax=Bacillus toyonensis TaxID=155322 RepID=UPI000BFCB1C7|nr:hypothetical protein [Bacillus toyonensis]PHE64271.1 hypothetical protein COF68_05360 [Bacillus toyonensis]